MTSVFFGETAPVRLLGVPCHENIALRRAEKEAIGRAAAALCARGEGVMIDGGSTTLQMCTHLDGLNLQVLTNSLHIVSALLPQAGTRILIPGARSFDSRTLCWRRPAAILCRLFMRRSFSWARLPSERRA